MSTTICSLLLGLVLHQAPFIKIKIVDENKSPIEGVYFYQGDHFGYSDQEGIVKIDESKINKNDSIYFSHLSYTSVSVLYSDLKKTDTLPVIQLFLDSKSLNEVVVSAFNASKYVKEAIDLIPINYVDPYDPYLNLNTDISYKRADKEEALLLYKGLLHFTLKKKKLHVKKLPETEVISPDLSKNVFFLKPHYGLSIVSVKRHPVIHKFKRYNFYKHEYLSYKNKNAIKLYFKERGGNPYEGHLIIETDTKAILSISYEMKKVDTSIIGTMKGRGIVKTGIDRYRVEVDYIRQEDSGKYIFDSGQANIDSNNRWKDNKVYLTSSVFLKRNTDEIQIDKHKGEEVELRKLF